MNAPAMPGPLLIDGGERDIYHLARSLDPSLRVSTVGRRGLELDVEHPAVSGRVTSMGLHFGMRMLVNQLRGRVPLELPVVHGPAPLEMSFCRGNGVLARASDGTEMPFGSGTFNVSRVARVSHFHYVAQEDAREQSVHVSLRPEALNELLGTPVLPLAVQRVLSSPDDFSHSQHLMNHRMFSLTDEIFEMSSGQAWGTSAGMALALEGKVLELLGLAVEQLQPSNLPQRLSDAERRAAVRARDLIAAQLDAVPSVQVLARQVGLGEKRLKASFKEAFGIPVMSYARRLRLERAKTMLTQRRHTVTEVAHRVGYANASKFAAAYRKEFGQNPGTFRGFEEV